MNRPLPGDKVINLLEPENDSEAQEVDRVVATANLITLLRKLSNPPARKMNHKEANAVAKLGTLVEWTTNAVKTIPKVGEAFSSWHKDAAADAEYCGNDKRKQRLRAHISDVTLFHSIWGPESAMVLKNVYYAESQYYFHYTARFELLSAVMKSPVCRQEPTLEQIQLHNKCPRCTAEDMPAEEPQGSRQAPNVESRRETPQ